MLHELCVHQSELQMQNEELRRTQAELAAARSRYFDLYDLAPVGYCTISDTEHILEGNLTAAALLGLPCSELVGKSIQRFIASADQDIYYLHFKKLVATGQPQSCELRLIKQDGSQFWAQLTATQTQQSTRHSAHRLVLIDINDRKVAQDQIRISDIALKAISQGVLITTPELCVVNVNAAFLSMTGYTEEELLGADCSLFNGPLTDCTTTAELVKAIKEERAFAGEVLNYRKDGSSFWNELAITPVLDDQGQLTHFISIHTDISERKRLDQALLEKNLALQHATLVAEKANLAKSEFLSSMSHELRSPLNAILGFAQLLETGTPALTPAQQVKTEKIQRGGWYLLMLINDILDLALIESGKLTLSLAPLSLARVLLECQSMIEPQAERHGIRVDFPQLASQFMVTADPLRLQQVIINLLSNAIKYNRSHGTVNLTVDTAAAGVLRISVHDTGNGIPEEKLSQLFEPFNRLGQEGSTTEGTGIGLVVTRRLTELMGGKIGVQSTVGVGSVFWIELEAAQALPEVKDDTAASKDEAQRPAPARPDPAPCTVLYVEDNLANMELVAQILATGRPNLQLLRAENGTQGIDMARNHRPQVILMDLHLPGISGLEALKVLRRDPATRHIPVLAISANAMPHDIAKGLAAGFVRYLTKPFKIDEFLAALDLALSPEGQCQAR
jgi:PAS domain S-box-containing protein